jgi:hypothetical protein
MENSSLVSYNEYIIDTESNTYRAIWNCQVEWTEECIYYDGETGMLTVEEGELEFKCHHPVKVTKHEYLQHAAEAKTLRQVSINELLQLLSSVAA